MRIDNKTTIENPTISLSWGWQPCEFFVSATYNNERNSYGRSIGKFIYLNGWVWQLNSDNTEDVNECFKGLKIEDLKIDNLGYYEPPTLTGNKVAIPEKWEALFPEDKFILVGFVIELERVESVLAVDIAYLGWEAFIEELDKHENSAIKRHMMPIWDYVLEQIQGGNFV